MPVKAYKISWLDSVNMEARIHLAMLEENPDRLHTLCGHGCGLAFRDRIWKPYRTGRHKKSLCPHCIKVAKEMGIEFSGTGWHEICPERDTTLLPQSSLLAQKWRKRRF